MLSPLTLRMSVLWGRFNLVTKLIIALYQNARNLFLISAHIQLPLLSYDTKTVSMGELVEAHLLELLLEVCYSFRTSLKTAEVTHYYILGSPFKANEAKAELLLVEPLLLENLQESALVELESAEGSQQVLNALAYAPILALDGFYVVVNRA